MTRPSGTFYAKVLLFGEYSLMVGSQALTIPFRKFSGSLHGPSVSPPESNQRWSSDMDADFDTTVSDNTEFLPEGSEAALTQAQNSNISLQAFLDYLLHQPSHIVFSESNFPGSIPLGSFQDILDLKAFKEDLAQGMYFRSDIPEGYGLGSSGALVAAVYERYAYESINPFTAADSQQLISILAAMETWFHGASSGIDPLSCYLNAGLQLDTGKRMTCKMVSAFPPLPGAFFLVDSGVVRKTGPLVQSFLDKAESSGFRRFLSKQYVPVNNACIAAVIGGDELSLVKNMQHISELQIHHFREMILPELLDAWKHGLISGDYHLKLCGSGGGGFLLGYTKNPEILKQFFPDRSCLQLSLPQ